MQHLFATQIAEKQHPFCFYRSFVKRYVSDKNELIKRERERPLLLSEPSRRLQLAFPHYDAYGSKRTRSGEVLRERQFPIFTIYLSRIRQR